MMAALDVYSFFMTSREGAAGLDDRSDELLPQGCGHRITPTSSSA
jgi:hypothetical protein